MIRVTDPKGGADIWVNHDKIATVYEYEGNTVINFLDGEDYFITCTEKPRDVVSLCVKAKRVGYADSCTV